VGTEQYCDRNSNLTIRRDVRGGRALGPTFSIFTKDLAKLDGLTHDYQDWIVKPPSGGFLFGSSNR
jgi:hypothetical protein